MIIGIIMVLLFAVLIGRIYELTIIEGENLSETFTRSIERDLELVGERGNIYDRFGYPLTENVLTYNVTLEDMVLAEDKNELIYELERVLKETGAEMVYELPISYDQGEFSFNGDKRTVVKFKEFIASNMPLEFSESSTEPTAESSYQYLSQQLFKVDLERFTTNEVMSILNIRYRQYVKRYTNYVPLLVASNVSVETIAIIEESSELFIGVNIEESYQRNYNDAIYFSHIIGYTRPIDSQSLLEMRPLGYDSNDVIGAVGIEKELESYLRSYDGRRSVEVNNLGSRMALVKEISPVNGNDVYLTIDRQLQIETYNILERQLAGIIVDKMRMKLPVSGEQRYILLKDVFDSIFRYQMIDVSSFELSENKNENNIFATYELWMKKAEALLNLESSIDADLYENEFDEFVYNYIYKQLALEGAVTGDYTKEAFDTYRDEALDHSVINHILTSNEFERQLYLELIDKEIFSYIDLTLALIHENIVTLGDYDIDELKNGEIEPIDFIKDKITNIELTPQALALDPSSGSVVVSDTDTGEVLALVSYPSYDNNRLVNDFDNEYYVGLLRDPTSPLYPRATQSKSAPGSTFKMVAGVAALEEGVVTIDEEIYATGYFNKIFPAAKCWVYVLTGRGHGLTDMVNSLEESCNYYFYEMGYRLSLNDNGKYIDQSGISIIGKYSQMFGLNSKTGLEIQEAASTLATRDSVRAMIGQGTHNYTPVQLNRYINVLVNDGVVRELNLVDKIKRDNGELIIDFEAAIVSNNELNQDNLDAVKYGMLQVTEGKAGTARRYFEDLPFSIAGKTGTAEQFKSRASHALFAGFAPYENPVVSIVTAVQFGYSSKYAALISRDVLSAYFDKDANSYRVTNGFKLE